MHFILGTKSNQFASHFLLFIETRFVQFVDIGDSGDCDTGRPAGRQESGQQLTLDPWQSSVVKLLISS